METTRKGKATSADAIEDEQECPNMTDGKPNEEERQRSVRKRKWGKSRSARTKYVSSHVYNISPLHRRPPQSFAMFQVASHPVSFNMHAHHHHQAPISIPTASIQLPRTLARPSFHEVSREIIMAAAPELANVPAEYIRRGLRSKAHQMLSGIASLSSAHMPPTMTKSHVPKVMSVPVRVSASAHASLPTHVLAVASSKSSATEHVFLFPVHSIVIASQCSAIPRLPSTASSSSGALHLPVLPLALPSPAAFKVLHAYLYNHSLEAVLRSLFPLPSAFTQGLSHYTVQSTLASGSSLHQLSSYLFSSAGSSLQVLTSHAAHVKELWQDMVALGLNDPELWDTLDLAWEITLGALNIAASNR